MKMQTKVKRILEENSSHWGKIFDLAELLPDDRARRLCACDYADRALALVAPQGVSNSECVAIARRFAEGCATDSELRKMYTAAATAAATAATAATAASFYFDGYYFRLRYDYDCPEANTERQWQIDHIVELLEKAEVQP